MVHQKRLSRLRLLPEWLWTSGRTLNERCNRSCQRDERLPVSHNAGQLPVSRITGDVLLGNSVRVFPIRPKDTVSHRCV